MRHQFWAGVRDMALVAAGVGVYGVVFGSLAQQAGLTAVQALGMSLIVYSGSAQLVALPLIQANAPMLTIVTTVLAMSLRHVVMGLSLAPYLTRVPLIGKLALAYAVNDETYAVTWARVERHGFRPAYMAGAGVLTLIAWIGSTALGHAAGQVLPPPQYLGLDFAFTALFIALLIPQVRSVGAILAVLAAGVAAVALTPTLGYGVGVAAGGVIGAVVGGWRER